MPLGQETTYETSCQTNVSDNIVETSTYRNIDLSSSASIVTSISEQLTQWLRIGLIKDLWAQRYRSYLRDGRVGSLILSTVNPSTMDVHSSSLLSPNAPAPDQLAEERSALSQVYSDTRSSDPESSPQPFASPHQSSQDVTDVTDESILIEQIVTNLKNLGGIYDIFRKKR